MAETRKATTSGLFNALVPPHQAREAWLQAAVAEMAGWIRAVGAPAFQTPQVSLGVPVGVRDLRAKSRAIGECWHRKCSNGQCTIHICPTLDTSIRILDVLLHEIIHAAVGIEAGHRGPFRRVAKAVGLVGPMTATDAGAFLKVRLAHLSGDLGRLPHAPLRVPGRPGRGPGGPGIGGPEWIPPRRPQPGRMVKASCGACGMVIRTTRKWIAEPGLPTCACGGEFELG